MKSSKSKELKEFVKLYAEAERLKEIKVKEGMSEKDLKYAYCDRQSEYGQACYGVDKLIAFQKPNGDYAPLNQCTVASLMEDLRDYDFSYHKVEDFLENYAYCYENKGKASARFAYCSSEFHEMVREFPKRK